MLGSKTFAKLRAGFRGRKGQESEIRNAVIASSPAPKETEDDTEKSEAIMPKLCTIEQDLREFAESAERLKADMDQTWRKVHQISCVILATGILCSQVDALVESNTDVEPLPKQ